MDATYAVTIAGLDDWPGSTLTREPPGAPGSPGQRPVEEFQPQTTRRPPAAPPRPRPGVPGTPPGTPIEPWEDAAALPPRPHWEDLLKLYLSKRMLDQGKALRGMDEVANSGRLYSIATGNPELTAMTDAQHQQFLTYLKNRTWRGKAIGPRTIRKHFRNLAPVFDYGGPLFPNGTDTVPTACKLGLYGVDQAGAPSRRRSCTAATCHTSAATRRSRPPRRKTSAAGSTAVQASNGSPASFSTAPSCSSSRRGSTWLAC